MALTNDSPISGLPELLQAAGFNDLLIISQSVDQSWFTAKISLEEVFNLFTDNLSINKVNNLEAILTELMTNKANVTHFHQISDIAQLQTTLNSKAPVNHQHLLASISGLVEALNEKANTNHIHTIESIQNLTTALNNKLNSSSKGQANGVADLDGDGLVPYARLPNIVNSIETYNSKLDFPAVGVINRLYIDSQANNGYLWNNLDLNYKSFVVGGATLVLGDTATNAYRGDLGKVAYQHSQSTHAPSDAQKNVRADWNAVAGDAFILNKPETMPPSDHTHSDIEINTKRLEGLAKTPILTRINDQDTIISAFKKIQTQIDIFRAELGLDTTLNPTNLTAVLIED